MGLPETITAHVPGWMKYASWLLTLSLGHILTWIGIFHVVFFTLATLVLLWRFFKVKFGTKIKPNGDLGILITGATSGFGLALAKMFYNLGFTIFATYYNDQEIGFMELKNLATHSVRSDRRPNTKRPHIFLIRMDVRSRDSIEDCGRQIDLLLDQNNIRLYSLINNAGISFCMPFQVYDRDSIMNVISTNVTGSMLVTRQFLVRIIQAKGKVICVSSGTHSFPMPSNEVYGASKAALNHFSVALHKAIEGYGASSHCMAPGNLLTASNIVYGNLKFLDNLQKNLPTNEQNFYQDLIIEWRNALGYLVASKLKQSGDNLDEIATIFNFNARDLVLEPKRSGGFGVKLIKFLLTLLTGGTSTLEGSLEAFKQVVCVEKPPITLYPGNPFYSYCIGPLAEMFPIWYNNLVGDYLYGWILRAEI